MILRIQVLDRESFCPKIILPILGKWVLRTAVEHQTRIENRTELGVFRVHPAAACAGGFPGMTAVSNEIGA